MNKKHTGSAQIFITAAIAFAGVVAAVSAPQVETVTTSKFEKPDEVRGIYLTASTWRSGRGLELVDEMVKNGGNAVTIDVEIGGGRLAFRPVNQKLAELNPGGDELDLKEVVDTLHDRGVYAIARQVVFKDGYMHKRNRDWGIYNKWNGLYDLEWLDPSKPSAQNYNLLVLEELALAGFDEIQFDYIRFPSTWGRTLNFHYDEENFTRADIINDFLKKARAKADEFEVDLAVDLFGGVVFGDVDWRIVGQHVPTLSKYVDAIYPMTYPSHYSPGYYGHYDMYYAPYNIVYDSIDRFVKQSREHLTKEDQEAPEIRTYVQGFSYKVVFNTKYVQDQIDATRDAGGHGFMNWNARNYYVPSWPTMGPDERTLENADPAPTRE